MQPIPPTLTTTPVPVRRLLAQRNGPRTMSRKMWDTPRARCLKATLIQPGRPSVSGSVREGVGVREGGREGREGVARDRGSCSMRGGQCVKAVCRGMYQHTDLHRHLPTSSNGRWWWCGVCVGGVIMLCDRDRKGGAGSGKTVAEGTKFGRDRERERDRERQRERETERGGGREVRGVAERCERNGSCGVGGGNG